MKRSQVSFFKLEILVFITMFKMVAQPMVRSTCLKSGQSA